MHQSENWIITPVRNNLQSTIRAVESFLDQSLQNIRILVVNNGSADNTGPWLASMADWVDSIHIYPQRGVAHAWNTGLRFVFGHGNYHALVVNNDVWLRPDTYRTLLRHGGGFVTAVGSDDPEAVRNAIPDITKTRPHPDFSCFLIRDEVFNRVGPFDEQFAPAFCEDWDYHCRLHQAGISAVSIGLPFLHVEGGSQTIKQMGSAEAKRLAEQAGLNRDKFAAKWGFAGGTPEYYAFFAARSDSAPHTQP